MSESDNDLDRLRSEIDDLDERLLALAAAREGLVRRITAAKRIAGEKPLFDRDRERAVYERARSFADRADLSPETANKIVEALVESAHRIQEQGSRAALTAHGGDRRRVLVIGGKGAMGRLFLRELAARGHETDAFDANDPRPREEVVAQADIVIIAVPMDRAAAVTAEVAPHVRPGALLCDINSLKQDVCDAMAPFTHCETLGMHPMFGPTVHSLRRQKIVVCPVNSGPMSAWLQQEFGRMGAEIIESDPAAHDRMMAVVQVLVHYSTLVMGKALCDSGVGVRESLRFTSPIYRLELAFVGRLFAQSPDLYAQIEMRNPYGESVRRAYREAAEQIDAIIAARDVDAFLSQFRDVSAYFEDFADEAMRLSDAIIDTLAMRP